MTTPEHLDKIEHAMSSMSVIYPHYAETYGLVLTLVADYRSLTALTQDGGELEEKAFIQTLEERDNAEDWADRLANGIARHWDIDIGEHSNLNNPWLEAAEHIEAQTAQPTEQEHPKPLPADVQSTSIGKAAAKQEQGGPCDYCGRMVTEPCDKNPCPIKPTAEPAQEGEWDIAEFLKGWFCGDNIKAARQAFGDNWHAVVKDKTQGDIVDFCITTAREEADRAATERERERCAGIVEDSIHGHQSPEINDALSAAAAAIREGSDG